MLLTNWNLYLPPIRSKKGYFLFFWIMRKSLKILVNVSIKIKVPKKNWNYVKKQTCVIFCLLSVCWVLRKIQTYRSAQCTYIMKDLLTSSLSLQSMIWSRFSPGAWTKSNIPFHILWLDAWCFIGSGLNFNLFPLSKRQNMNYVPDIILSLCFNFSHSTTDVLRGDKI